MKESTISIILASVVLTTGLLLGFKTIGEQKCPALKPTEKIVGACEKLDNDYQKAMCTAKTACGNKLKDFKYDNITGNVIFNCNK